MAAKELVSTPLFSDANLVGYWRFEDNVLDETTNNIDGSANNIVYSNLKFGKGIGPNGTSAPSVVVSSASFNVTTGNASWCFWVNSTSYPSSGDVFVAFSLTGGYNVSGYYGQIVNNLFTFRSNQSGAHQDVSTPSNSVLANNLYFICCVKNGTNVKIYINGTEATSGTITNPASAGNDLCLINYAVSKTYRGPAVIDDFSFFSRALSATEISNLYNGNWPSSNFFAFF